MSGSPSIRHDHARGTEAVGFFPAVVVAAAPGERELRKGRPGYRDEAHQESNDEERQQLDPAARSVEPGAGRDLKERGEIAEGGIEGDGENGEHTGRELHAE